MSELIKDFQPDKVKPKSLRNDLFKQIYSFYYTEQEKMLKKKANWKRYVQYLKDYKLPNTFDNQKKFKKSKFFIRKMTDKQMACFFLAHVKTDDLWFVLSVAKDKAFRKESVGAYIMSLSTDKPQKTFDKKW